MGLPASFDDDLVRNEPGNQPDDAQVVDLDDWLDRADDTEPIDLDAEPSSPEDNERANWMLRKLRTLEAQDADDARLVRAEKAKLDAWLDARKSSRARSRAWFTQALEGYMRIVARRDNVKSLSLPNGRLKLSKPSERIVTFDPDAFAEWSGLNAFAFSRPKIEPDKVELKRKCQPIGYQVEDANPAVESSSVAFGGEVIPGVAIERDTTDRFGVEL